ncbi:MAG: chemotaxis protein methyltransferase CheR [Fibrobacteres bacterium]|nr:chemotaxis protein methyltransferase CheR [Fibrobacterota bacterium]
MPQPDASRLRLILDSALDAIVTIDSKGSVIDWNKRAESLFGWTSGEAMGRSMTELFIPHRHRDAHSKGMARFLASGEGPILGKRIELPALHRDGREFPVELTVTPAKSGDEWIFCAFLRDLTLIKAAENRLSLQYAVTQILSEAKGLAQAAPELLKAIFRLTPWEAGALYCVSEKGADLECLCADLSASNSALADFVGKSWVRRFKPGIGLPGKVWQSGEYVWLPRVSEAEWLTRYAEAVSAGIVTALAYPIFAGDRLHGVLELFSKRELPKDGEMLKVLLNTGSQIGQFAEKRKAENALAQREQDLSDFVENASMGMHWVGPDGIILWANKCELDMLGYTKEEYVGRHIADFHADAPVIDDILKRLSSQEVLRDHEARLRRKDGSIRHVLINSNVKWDDKNFIHTRCFSRDISPWKAAEVALAESESRFKTVADSAPILIWMSGPDASCEYFNRPWLEFRGRSLEQESRNEWIDGIHPDDSMRSLEAYKAAFRERRPFRIEFRLKRADGEYRWMVNSGTPRSTPAGAFLGYIGSCLDINDRKGQVEGTAKSSKT